MEPDPAFDALPCPTCQGFRHSQPIDGTKLEYFCAVTTTCPACDGTGGSVNRTDNRELRVENPKLCAQFVDWLQRQDAPVASWNFGAIAGEIVNT